MSDLLTPRFRIDYSFGVHFTRDAFAADNDVLATVLANPGGRPPARCLVAIDAAVLRARPELPRAIHAWFHQREERGLRLAAEPVAIDGGEAAKASLAVVERMGARCAELGLCRHSYVVMIGGGAVLDAVGLAATLVHRGLRQVRLPTTSLGQADAGLGVKNAVNAFGQKNFLGTFQPPHAVVNDLRFLESLDDRSWRAGVAEAVKVACIKDRAFLIELSGLADAIGARDGAALERVVRRCAELHLDHIAHGGDPFERGNGRPLDFGHWSAHRLEVLSQHRLLHGEAVAIGVAIDLCYAAEAGFITPAEAEAVCDTLRRCGFRLWDECLELRDVAGARLVLTGLAQFREHLGGELTLAMPDGLGRCQDVHAYDAERCERALQRLRGFNRVAPPTAVGLAPADLP